MRNPVFLLIFMLIVALPVSAEDAVVARVNGAVITARDLEEAVNILIPQATYHGNVSEEKRDELRQKALDELIDRELQYQDATAKNMRPEKKLVDERMDTIRGRYATKKDYKKALQAAGISEDQLYKLAAKAILIETNIRKTVVEPAQVNDEALKGYYDKNLTKFKQPETVRLRIISAKDEQKGKEALSRIKAGEDFGNVAARMSEDNYRIRGGDIGYIHKGRIFHELEEAAFKMKVGETSDLIKADETWFIVRVEDKKPALQKTFEESKDKLKKDLENKRAAELKEEWLGSLRAKARIEMLWKPASDEQDAASQATEQRK